MLQIFLISLSGICAAVIGSLYYSRLSMLRSARDAQNATGDPSRYRPMLRILSEDDLEFAAGNAELMTKLRTQRRRVFRQYLRSLTRDYGRLLSGIRLAMVHSKVDRPDLYRALQRNQRLFAWALCRIEFRLALHAMGIGSVDVSVLVAAIETLSAQVRPMAVPSAA